MTDMPQPPISPIRNFLPVLVGTLVAVGVLFILQYWVRGGPPGDVIPYEDVIRPYTIRHTRAEIAGLIAGIFIGSLVSSFIFRPVVAWRGVWIALFVVIIVVVSPWRFSLQKEIIFLILPIWLIVGLAGFYVSRFIKR